MKLIFSRFLQQRFEFKKKKKNLFSKKIPANEETKKKKKSIKQNETVHTNKRNGRRGKFIFGNALSFERFNLILTSEFPLLLW